MGRASWARWAHEVFTWLVLLAIPASHDVYGWRGPALITLFVSPTTCVLDWLVSNTFQSNLQRLNKFGYSTRQVVFVMGYNLVTSNALMVAVKAVYCPDALGAIRQLDCLKVLKMAAAVVVSLGLTEVAFTPGHSYLHNTQRGARLHLMHHCCRPSSWSANLIFHPMDMIIEFGAPILTLVAAYHVVWRSVLDDEAGLSLLASVTTLHLWYALDHSENLKLPHYTHHLHVNAVLTVYLDVRNRFPGRDKVKGLLAAGSSKSSKRLD